VPNTLFLAGPGQTEQLINKMNMPNTLFLGRLLPAIAARAHSDLEK
jgi:hypothetical protein